MPGVRAEGIASHAKVLPARRKAGLGTRTLAPYHSRQQGDGPAKELAPIPRQGFRATNTKRLRQPVQRQMSTLEPVKLGVEQRLGTCPGCDTPIPEIRVLLKPEDVNKPWTRQRCPSCVDANERKLAEMVAAEKHETRCRAAIAALDIPPMYADVTLDEFQFTGDVANRQKQGRSLQLARRFLAGWPDVPMISLFVGVPGSGKGHVAWSLCRELAATYGATTRVVVLSDAVRDLREAWGSRDDGGLSEAQRLAKYRNADLLVIDEVSSHAFYGQPQQHLYDLVAWREIRLKPTILTTNETGQSLADFLGAALSSRALGWGPPVDFGDVDFRLTRGLRRQA